MSKKHRVRINKWLDGSLAVIEAWFENFEDSLAHGRSHEAQSIKVFDEDGQLVHVEKPIPPEQYQPTSTYA